MPISFQLPDGQRQTLDVSHIVIGRSENCQIRLPDLSPEHAKITRVANRWLLESMGDWLLMVGDQEPARKNWLKSGDVIKLSPKGPEIVFEPTPVVAPVSEIDRHEASIEESPSSAVVSAVPSPQTNDEVQEPAAPTMAAKVRTLLNSLSDLVGDGWFGLNRRQTVVGIGGGVLALLFIVLLVAWFGDDDGPKRQTGAKHGHSDRSITYFPNANRTLEDVQSKLRRIQGDTKTTTPAPSPQQPRSQEHRPPSAAPRVPETPKAESHRPASKQASGSVNRDGQPGRLLQTEIPLVDEPLDGLPGGRYVDWSPDGKVLLTSTGSGKARLWDVPTWRGINFKLPNGQESDVIQAQSAVFSPHETKLATFAINDTLAPMNPPVLRVWDLETRPVTLINKVEVRKVTGMNAGGLWPGLVWSANGDTLVSGRPGTMSGGSRGPGGGLLFLGEEGLKGQYVDSSPELWMHVSVSPNGQLAVMATDQPRTAKVIAVPEGKSIKTIPLGKHSWTYQLYSDFSPDGKLFAATFEEEGTEHNGGGDETTVRLFDTSTWEQRSVLPATEGEVSFHFAAFSPDSKLLATAAGSTWDNTVTLWDVQTGKKIREFETKCPRVVLFSPDSSTMVTGGNTYLKQDEQYNVDFWDVATGRPKARIVAGKTYALALSPSQHFLVTGDMDEHAWLWDLTTLHGTPHVDQNTGQSTRIVADQQRRDAPVEDIPEPEHATTRPAQSPQTSKPQIVNLAMPKSPLPIGVHDGGVTGMAVSPDGKLLVTAGHYGDIKIWSLPEGKPLKRIENANVGGVMVAIGPDGRQLVTVGARKYPKLWSLPDGERMKTLHWVSVHSPVTV